MSRAHSQHPSPAAEAGAAAARPIHSTPSMTSPATGNSDPQSFYVSVIRDRRAVLASGPYPDHPSANGDVERIQKICGKLDPWSHFDKFGTASTAATDPGSLQRHGVMSTPGPGKMPELLPPWAENIRP